MIHVIIPSHVLHFGMNIYKKNKVSLFSAGFQVQNINFILTNKKYTTAIQAQLRREQGLITLICYEAHYFLCSNVGH